MNSIGFFFGVWLCCSSSKNKFPSNFIFLQSSLKFLELWKSIFSTYIRKDLIWLLGRKLWCEKLKKIPTNFVSMKIWSAFLLHWLYDSSSHITYFSINYFFSNSMLFGERIFITSGILCSFLQLFRLF